ncbi:hypothetical protein [Mycobacterium florentinum]|uniref:hypothetical protein n=1 Tax=Mycobacterium florentinum TaxID=292462 RepID=UPI0013CFE495
MAVLDETLARNGIRDLVAVVSVGGGANIPAVTTMLSGHLRVPVVTTPSAPGAGHRRGVARDAWTGETSATMLTPAASRATAPLPPHRRPSKSASPCSPTRRSRCRA